MLDYSKTHILSIFIDRSRFDRN